MDIGNPVTIFLHFPMFIGCLHETKYVDLSYAYHQIWNAFKLNTDAAAGSILGMVDVYIVRKLVCSNVCPALCSHLENYS